MTRASADPQGQARAEGPQLPTRADLDRAGHLASAMNTLLTPIVQALEGRDD